MKNHVRVFRLFLFSLFTFLTLAVPACVFAEGGGCVPYPDATDGPCSPIIIDTTGGGFHLTSAKNGVMFDIAGNGHPVQIAWTEPGSGNAFLALDRNHNGKIDSGEELFGNFTPQSKSAHPNGYLALAEFDKPENGGNGDGIIDQRDAVFPYLLLWIDENHDGISQPNELHSLPELGVDSIGLKYHEDPYVDEWGNRFRYRGRLNPDPRDGESSDGRFTYDVFLQVATGENAALSQTGMAVNDNHDTGAVDLAQAFTPELFRESCLPKEYFADLIAS